MYCNQCGKQVAEHSKFCNHCGADILSSEKRTDSYQRYADDNLVLYHFKPEFYRSYTLKKLIPAFIFSSFFFSILITVFKGFGMAFREFGGRNSSNHFGPGPGFNDSFNDTPFQLSNIYTGVAIAFFLTFIIGYIIYKKRYAHAEFIFYQDRLEYIDGFFNYNKKQISYKNIREISMSQNVFQRKHNIGTIVLTTSAVTYTRNRAYNNGISVYDIKNVDDHYQEIKKLVK